MSPYIVDKNHHIYLDVDLKRADEILRDIENYFSLKRLQAGGNVLFALPFYKSSVFRDSQIINHFPVVSNLQLYLDLMGFPPAGWEQAKWILKHLKEEGTPLV
ncbi:MAG: hypothetical protein HYT97_05190 [Elusimicrobia bacterium]|nr:hypothetical protein [Elusimicrobiota bacterium]